MIAELVQDAARYRIPLFIAGAVVAAVLLALLIRLAVRLVRRIPAGTPWFYYLASLGGLAVSLNTSWRFFGLRLGITGAERVVMFSVLELALVACALGMRANVRRVDQLTGRPGAAGVPRTVAWVLCGLSAYAALLLSGPIDGIARVALGPILSLVMLHMALGIEIRNHTAIRTGTWARVGAEMRERVLSRLGLADDDRDALTRTRERAARRVARLALGKQTSVRGARLSRALRASNIAHDQQIQQRMLAELAVLRHAGELATLPLPSPWSPPTATPIAAPVAEPVTAPTTTHAAPPIAMPAAPPVTAPVTTRVAAPRAEPVAVPVVSESAESAEPSAEPVVTPIAERSAAPAVLVRKLRPVLSPPPAPAQAQSRFSEPWPEPEPSGPARPANGVPSVPARPLNAVPTERSIPFRPVSAARTEPAVPERGPSAVQTELNIPVPNAEPIRPAKAAPAEPGTPVRAAKAGAESGLAIRAAKAAPAEPSGPVRSTRSEPVVPVRAAAPEWAGPVRTDSERERGGRAAIDGTDATGMLDAVLLAAHTSPEWASETSTGDAIDLADELLPRRSPQEMVVILSQIGVSATESDVRRRRAGRPAPADQEHEHSA